MESTFVFDEPFVESIFHPSDFSSASENAFAHALAFALLRSTALTILHAESSDDNWQRFPAVRETLRKWGFLDGESSRSAVYEDLAVRVKKVSTHERSPLDATLHYLEKHPTDLIVLSTEGREGLPRWISPSVAERIALKSKTKTLFVPQRCKGFVGAQDGTIDLRRILVPVDFQPSPLPAIEYAARAASLTGDETEVVLLHVGDITRVPSIQVHKHPGISWRTVTTEGTVVEEIVRSAEAFKADLIVMSTAGHEGFLDAVRGSVTEQVLRRSPCPLLAVPTF